MASKHKAKQLYYVIMASENVQLVQHIRHSSVIRRTH